MSRVLVVDDEDAIRNIISTILTFTGYEVIEARNGLDAVAIFRSCADLIDLVITDLKMPVLNGYETVRRIREIKPAIRIIYMSASDVNTPVDALFLSKPFNIDDVRACVGDAMAMNV
jgi:CheY-like chemotaxis protein